MAHRMTHTNLPKKKFYGMAFSATYTYLEEWSRDENGEDLIAEIEIDHEFNQYEAWIY